MTFPRLVGMIHLPPLPGTSTWEGQTQQSIEDAACADARTLESAGFDGVMIQNSLDRPTRGRVDVLSVAQMATIVTAVRKSVAVAVGVNVLKNDGPAAVAIAAASEAQFVRVKVLTGAVLSAEGIVSGCAHDVQSLRTRSRAAVSIWADVYEPTSRALLSDDFDAAVVDALEFGLADAVIVTASTALETLDLARRVRRMHPGARVIIGGRIDLSTVAQALTCADTVIIGSALKVSPGIRGRVDFDCARAIIAQSRTARVGASS